MRSDYGTEFFFFFFTTFRFGPRETGRPSDLTEGRSVLHELRFTLFKTQGTPRGREEGLYRRRDTRERSVSLDYKDDHWLEQMLHRSTMGVVRNFRRLLSFTLHYRCLHETLKTHPHAPLLSLLGSGPRSSSRFLSTSGVFPHHRWLFSFYLCTTENLSGCPCACLERWTGSVLVVRI